MQYIDFVPYDCEKCYFCLNGHTTGNDHKRKMRIFFTGHKSGTRVMSGDCIEQRASLQKTPRYCGMCYRKQDELLSKKFKKKMQNINHGMWTMPGTYLQELLEREI